MINILSKINNTLNDCFVVVSNLTNLESINGNYDELLKLGFTCESLINEAIDLLESIKSVDAMTAVSLNGYHSQLKTATNQIRTLNEFNNEYIFNIEKIIKAIQGIIKTIKVKSNNSIHSVNNKTSKSNTLRIFLDKEMQSLQSSIEQIKTAAKDAEKVSHNSLSAAASVERIEVAQQQVKEFVEQLNNATKQAQSDRDRIQQLVDQTLSAKSVITSVALGGVFHTKSAMYLRSMTLWVLALTISLITIAYLGNERFTLLNDVIATESWKRLSLHLLLTALGVGPVFWFAWLSTKQINYCFKLSEDYGYKASVSSALEGYRNHAKVDIELEIKLINSVIQRFDESPLRHIEMSHHGSPLHEALNSKSLHQLLKQTPDWLDKIIALISPSGSTAPRVKEKFQKEPS